MNNRPSDNKGKYLGAALIGAAIGALLGMLFAPRKGSETRRKIADTAAEFGDRLRKTSGTVPEYEDPEREKPV